MMSFLEFYEILLSFINFKLFHSLGETYPPVYDPVKFSNGVYLSAMSTIAFNEDKSNGQPSVEEIKKDIEKEVDKTKEFELKKKTKERVKSLSKVLVGVDENEKSIPDKENVIKEKKHE